MKYTILLFVFVHSFCFTGFACLNEEDQIWMMSQNKTKWVPYGHDFDADREKNESRLLTLETKWKQKKDYKALNDYGVTLVYLGRFEEALGVFQKIEKQKPGRYSTAANMGTIYEVLGKNDSALYWIKRGVELNPASHDSSEWLHVKILEAKLKGGDNFTGAFFTGVDFGDSTKPTSVLTSAQLKALRNALYYQLNERVSFIKPTDKMIALLLFELANITSLTDSVRTATDNYKLAQLYGYNDKLLQKRIDLLVNGSSSAVISVKNKDELPEEGTRNYIGGLLFVVLGLILLTVGVFVFKRKRE